MRPHNARAWDGLEVLESRVMLTATGLTVSPIAAMTGLQLLVRGTPGADVIDISQNGANLTVADGVTGWSQTYGGPFSAVVVRAGKGFDQVTLEPSVTLPVTLYGGNGADTLTGGSGPTALYGGLGRNQLVGGPGNDAFVLVGNNNSDTLTGGGGHDSFWLDNRTDQVITDPGIADTGNNVHRIGSFYQPPPTSLGAGNGPGAFPEPQVTDKQMTYQDFSGDPLFSSLGPSPNDVRQGFVGDCYYVATLSSIAKADPNLIRQSIVDLGDGTYAVHYVRNGTDVYIHVDGQLPVWSPGDIAYAGLGQQNSLWVALMEKAYAFFRYDLASYASIDGGWMSEVYSALGTTSSTINQASGAQWLLQQIQDLLDAGRSVTYGVLQAPAGSPLISYHAYMVDSVQTDSAGNAIALRLRNPWGIGGPANDGYITVSAAQALAAFWAVMSAAV